MLGGEHDPATARSNFKIGQVDQFWSDASVRKSKRKTVRDAFEEIEPNFERLILPNTNMERFLWTIMPSVPAQFVSKTTMQDWRACNVQYQPFFRLDDLWNCFREWSVYGAGVPLMLDARDYVIQYYVPYLSAIQIYVDPSKLPSNWRQGSQENESRCSVKDPIAQSPKIDNSFLKDQQNGVKGHLSNHESGRLTPQGYLLFEYLENDTPFTRKTLFNKISGLALCCSELKDLRSCDILSSSWVSVAWYPIYKIPTAPAMKDLDACFLTFHHLSTPLGDPNCEQAPVVTHPNEAPKIPLPSFGLSTYKYRESTWGSGSSGSQKLVKSLSEAAYKWLNMLQVQSPDYNFFASRR